MSKRLWMSLCSISIVPLYVVSFDDLGSSLMLFGGVDHAIAHRFDDKPRAGMFSGLHDESCCTIISKSRPLDVESYLRTECML
jgi:hypothetical protein